MIDCGVILGTADSTRIMTEVVEHIIKTTGGHVDLVVATHEHWDHISGFGQASEIWTDKSRLTIGAVWLSWAEDSKNSLARKCEISDRRENCIDAAASRMLWQAIQAGEKTYHLLLFGAVTDDELKIKDLLWKTSVLQTKDVLFRSDVTSKSTSWSPPDK